jgi:predicted PurR-regulated permease PerM
MSDDPSAEPASGASEPGPSLPQDMRTVLLAGIFVLLSLFALYLAAAVAIPFVFAVLLKLLLQPGVRQLSRLRVPPPLGALVMILVLFHILGGSVYLLAAPAAGWAQRAPESLPRLEQKLSVLKVPMGKLQATVQEVEKFTAPGDAPPTVAVQGPGLLDYLFSGTRHLLGGIGITVLMLFFLLSSGDLFMRKLVEILPSFRDKKQAVAISYEVEDNISAYLLTITVMNLAVGCATALAMWLIGLADPLLWGALAFVLNYVLILGPLAAILIFAVAGLLAFDTLWQALLPPLAYAAIHIVEGEWATPTLVARRFTLNPVLVVGSLIFWNWMWGIPGVLLAVPMLTAFKIVCDGVRPLTAVGHFIGG